jgi:superfamily I DNA and/or RNA helicase
MLADKLRQPDHPLLQITIDTVERFQGSQRRYIIYGLTVQKHYQLRFLSESAFEENGRVIDRKLNVAMTRAQEYLIIVGNALLLSRIPVYANLIHYINNRGNIAAT